MASPSWRSNRAATRNPPEDRPGRTAEKSSSQVLCTVLRVRTGFAPFLGYALSPSRSRTNSTATWKCSQPAACRRLVTFWWATFSLLAICSRFNPSRLHRTASHCDVVQPCIRRSARQSTASPAASVRNSPVINFVQRSGPRFLAMSSRPARDRANATPSSSYGLSRFDTAIPPTPMDALKRTAGTSPALATTARRYVKTSKVRDTSDMTHWNSSPVVMRKAILVCTALG